MKKDRIENLEESEFVPVELRSISVEEYEAMDDELCIASAD